MKKDNNVYFHTDDTNLLATDLDTNKVYEVNSIYSTYSLPIDSFFLDLLNNQASSLGKLMPIVWFEPNIKTQILNKIQTNLKKSAIIHIKDDKNKYINTKVDSNFEQQYHEIIKHNSVLYISNNIHLRNEEEKLKQHYKKEFFEFLKFVYKRIEQQKKTLFIISTDDSIFNIKEVLEINKFLKKAKQYGHRIIFTHRSQKSSIEIDSVLSNLGLYDYKLLSYATHTSRDRLSIIKTKKKEKLLDFLNFSL